MISDPNAGAAHTAERWFDTSVFRLPAQFAFGGAGRNITFGDNEINLDVSLLKDTTVNERIRLQFRAEMFNALNHTNFGLPIHTMDSLAVGTITSAAPARVIQLGARLQF